MASQSVVGGVSSMTASSVASTSPQNKDATGTAATSREQPTSECCKDSAEYPDLRDMLNRIKCHRHWKPKRREARSYRDEYLGKTKPSAVSAKPITLRPRAASPSAEAEVPSVTALSEASTSSQLQDAAPTMASLQQQQTSESGTNLAECKDLRAKVHRTKCRRRRKPKCGQARSDDDDFLGEVKSSTASANIIAFCPRVASPSAEAGVPLVTASSEASTSLQLQDAASFATSSREQQTGEAECEDLREKQNCIRCHRRPKLKCREARSDTDLRAV